MAFRTCIGVLHAGAPRRQAAGLIPIVVPASDNEDLIIRHLPQTLFESCKISNFQGLYYTVRKFLADHTDVGCLSRRNIPSVAHGSAGGDFQGTLSSHKRHFLVTRRARNLCLMIVGLKFRRRASYGSNMNRMGNEMPVQISRGSR